MKKGIIYSLLVLLSFSACEKDDICIEATTSNLIIRLYDANAEETKKQATGIYVWLVANDTLSAYQNVTLDSIAIPLDPNSDISRYVIQQNDTNDTLTINYTRNEVFISRSCGFKINYEGLNLQDITNNWIERFTIENQTVENETAAHIHIFH